LLDLNHDFYCLIQIMIKSLI